MCSHEGKEGCPKGREGCVHCPDGWEGGGCVPWVEGGVCVLRGGRGDLKRGFCNLRGGRNVFPEEEGGVCALRKGRGALRRGTGVCPERREGCALR